MGESYKDSSLKIFSLNGNRPLAEKIAKVFGTELGKSKVTQFSDGGIAINIEAVDYIHLTLPTKREVKCPIDGRTTSYKSIETITAPRISDTVADFISRF